MRSSFNDDESGGVSPTILSRCIQLSFALKDYGGQRLSVGDDAEVPESKTDIMQHLRGNLGKAIHLRFLEEFPFFIRCQFLLRM